MEMSPLPRGYDTFDAGWFHLSYPASMSHWVEPLMKEATAFRNELSARFGHPVLSKVRVRIAEDPAGMALLAPLNAPFPKYAVGVAYSRLRLILLTKEPVHDNAQHDLLETFRHELAHLALHEAVDGHPVPLWFNEGLAVHLSREKAFARTQTLWTAVVSDNLLPLGEIERHFPHDMVGVPLAYAQSADVVRYLLRQEDQERFELLIRKLRRGQEFDRALYGSYGMDSYNLEQVWRMDAESRYTVWPVVFTATGVWVGAAFLVVLAWRRKRQRAQRTLRRWAREEAVEEWRKVQAQERETEPWASVSSDARPVVLVRESPVPMVQHDGDWHTLH